MSYTFDLFVIGAGPAGLAAAKQAAQYGMHVAIAEQAQFGGCCVNRGCIPKKLMLYAADMAATFRDQTEFGWDACSSQFHWQQFRHKRDQELQRLQQVQHQALQKAGVQILTGHTQLLDPHTLDVEGQKSTASNILIAVGGKPIKPGIPGIEHTLTSRELLNLEHLPRHLAIIGGGYIGVEFASMFRSFGCEVTLMDVSHCILDGFDEDLSVAVRDGLIQRGIHSYCNTTAQKIDKTPEGLCLHLKGDCPETVTADVVLCATGRAPNLDDLGLEAAGVEFDKKAIAVDDLSRTNQPHIYAVGDCTNRKALTPVAKTEGKIAVDTMAGKPASGLDYNLVPSAVFSRPEAASVGLTESAARERYGDAVTCDRQTFIPLRYSLTSYQQQAMVKLVVEQESDRLLGIHMVGEHAAEAVQGAAIALRQSMTRQELMQVIGIHPTTAEEIFAF